MWDIILRLADLPEDLPTPCTNDEFEAAVGYVLGAVFLRDQADRCERCIDVLGNARDGAFLVPYEPLLFSDWDIWSKPQRTQASSRQGR